MKARTEIFRMIRASGLSLLLAGTLISGTAQPPADATKMLKKNVEEAYYRYYIDPIDISVNALGVVELKGAVPSYWDKLNIYSNIAKVKGVTHINDLLTVDTETVPDVILKDEIVNAIRLTQKITEPEKIQTDVDNGLVLLRGTVNYYREAEVAEDIAASMKGVRSVDNELAVLPLAKAESDSNLTDIIQDVLKDQFSPGSSHVKVGVTGGIVVLSGSADSVWLKNAVDKQIRAILGVKGVQDNLTVVPEQ